MRPDRRRFERPFDSARYEAWLRSLRWSLEEIAGALETLADEIEAGNGTTVGVAYYRSRAAKVREGRVTKRDLGDATAVLITRCDLCDRKAIYRSGSEGRCRAHKHIPARSVLEKRQRLEAKSDAIAAKKDDIDRGLRLRDARNRFHASRLGFR